jgi:Tol biopolymer transport system component
VATVDGTTGRAANAGGAWPSFSPDGTRLAFYSGSGVFGPNDTNGDYDLYVRDLAAGTTTLVSVNAAGTGSGAGASFPPSSHGPEWSADGTRMLFASAANDLVANDPVRSPRPGERATGDLQNDVFVRDLAAGRTILVSTDAQRTRSSNARSASPRLAPDGHRVAFVSDADDLGAPTTDCRWWGPSLPLLSKHCQNVYLRDIDTGATALVSTDLAGPGGNHGGGRFPQFSPDGTKIAFTSFSGTRGTTTGALNSTDENIFVRDLTAGTTTLVTVNASGVGGQNNGNEMSEGWFAFDATGTRVVFVSDAPDLVPADGPRAGYLYVRNLATRRTSAVANTDPAAGPLDIAPDHPAGFSPDGRRIGFLAGDRLTFIASLREG